MKIAVVHSFYRSTQVSGENNVVQDQVQALRGAGHEVLLASASSDDLAHRRIQQAVVSAFNVATGEGWSPLVELEGFKPDVVHVHNLFPNIGTKWLSKWPGPVVSTLHNYRPLCANALLFRADHVCTECPDGKKWSGVQHGCYKDSRLATLPIAIRNSGGLEANPLLSHSAAVVTLSKKSQGVYERYGLKSSQSFVIPNFVNNIEAKQVTAGQWWAYAGRLDQEKGFFDLVSDWPPEHKLQVFGGKIEGHLQSRLTTSISDRGAVRRDDLRQALRLSLGVVFPSVMLEHQPTVVMEAFEAGAPVVARAGSAGADLVEEFQAGAVYGPGHLSLRDALAYVSKNQVELRQRARAAYEQNFTEKIWLSRIEQLYRTVIAEAKPRPS